MLKKTSTIKKLFIILGTFALLLTTSMCFGATYYVDATNGNDSNNGLSLSKAWKTIAKVNSSSFQPIDFILLKRGEVWREQLIVPSSGSPGKPITFGTYGGGDKPVINGGVLVKDWTTDIIPNVYFALVTDEPLVVVVDEVQGKKETAKSGLTANYEWYWDSSTGKLWVYSTSDISGRIIEKGNLWFNIIIDGKDHITIKNIACKISTWNNFTLKGDSDNIILESLSVKNSYNSGITAKYPGGYINDLIIRNCDISQSGNNGIGLNEVNTVLILNNKIHNCNLRGNASTHGIRVVVDDDSYPPINVITENNEVYKNGYFIDGTEVSESQYVGKGIHYDKVGSIGNIIRYNKVYDNHAPGIHVEISNNVQVYYNLSYNNDGTSGACGLALTGWGSYTLNGNKFYNNTVYGNTLGICAWGSDSKSDDQFTNNIFKNNISVDNTTRDFVARWGGENDGTVGSGNVYTYNDFGAESPNFIEWGNGTYKSTYDDWEVVYGSRTNSVEENPLFTNAGFDFSLKPTSLCIDAGTDVGLGRDYLGTKIPQGFVADIGAYEFVNSIAPPKNLHFLYEK